MKDQIRKAHTAGNLDEVQSLEKQLALEMRRLQEECEAKKEMLRASFTDGQLDSGRITSLVDSLIARKPRNYIDVLKNYRRLLRLEVEKRRARIETASDVLSPRLLVLFTLLAIALITLAGTMIFPVSIADNTSIRSLVCMGNLSA